MKNDVYTRVVLTVIALCLLWLCIGKYIYEVNEAHADSSGIVQVDIVKIGGSRVYSPLPVTVGKNY